MAGLVPAIHVCLPAAASKTWMPATGAGMTWSERSDHIDVRSTGLPGAFAGPCH
jgi:hypothetical protein